MAILFALTTPVFGYEYVITNDQGGVTSLYLKKYRSMYVWHDTAKIDGLCASACTLVLMLPRERICVTEQAVLGFDAPSLIFASRTNMAVSPENWQALDILMKMYPPPFREWISHKGGLTKKMIYLRGPELADMLPRC